MYSILWVGIALSNKFISGNSCKLTHGINRFSSNNIHYQRTVARNKPESNAKGHFPLTLFSMTWSKKESYYTYFFLKESSLNDGDYNRN